MRVYRSDPSPHRAGSHIILGFHLLASTELRTSFSPFLISSSVRFCDIDSAITLMTGSVPLGLISIHESANCSLRPSRVLTSSGAKASAYSFTRAMTGSLSSLGQEALALSKNSLGILRKNCLISPTSLIWLSKKSEAKMLSG